MHSICREALFGIMPDVQRATRKRRELCWKEGLASLPVWRLRSYQGGRSGLTQFGITMTSVSKTSIDASLLGRGLPKKRCCTWMHGVEGQQNMKTSTGGTSKAQDAGGRRRHALTTGMHDLTYLETCRKSAKGSLRRCALRAHELQAKSSPCPEWPQPLTQLQHVWQSRLRALQVSRRLLPSMALSTDIVGTVASALEPTWKASGLCIS